MFYKFYDNSGNQQQFLYCNILYHIHKQSYLRIDVESCYRLYKPILTSMSHMLINRLHKSLFQTIHKILANRYIENLLIAFSGNYYNSNN